ncbi:serine hydrolase [Lysinibacillus fusiformis]|uniref:serine hydrolase n=1 Tax=Lysinibacillus fusiformis TaxID=28031 RepID=UPI002852B6BD|nr:serine hydrolase [Lysinibacillus fusiformis]WKT76320.1 serine hydrolase [Lysinibacillus fusiformis]WKT79887.1 serine hydrolase [Lysinibacillus fusiformis]
MKKWVWLTGGLLVCTGFVIGIVFWKIQKEVKKDDPEYIVQFMKENKGNKNVSVAIQYNRQSWVEQHTKEPLPLASTVKIIVAIAYAQQAADGHINPQQQVRLRELETFYIPKTDGGAHEAWLAQLNLNGKESVPLSEVAKGMITYSSNANTDYLMHVLGLQTINEVLTQLDVKGHEPLYPIASALYIPIQLRDEKSLTKKETLTALKDMGMAEYRERALAIHENWLEKPLTKEEKAQAIKMLNLDVQRVWSDRLIRASTSDYISILEKLNSKNYFTEDVHKYLDPVMEQLMQNPRNQVWLTHAGQKGGSTAFVLTLAAYAEDKEGNQTEIAFFANDLNTMAQIKLSNSMNSFQLKFLTDEKFRVRLQRELSM